MLLAGHMQREDAEQSTGRHRSREQRSREIGAVIGPARTPAGAITSFPTQANFLADGRVAYVRVCMEGDSPSGKREVWIANPDGSVAKKWLDLPRLGVGNTSGDSFTVSRDGRTIAYIWQGKAYVQRVQPPK